jgi:hypothetical protein
MTRAENEELRCGVKRLKKDTHASPATHSNIFEIVAYHLGTGSIHYFLCFFHNQLFYGAATHRADCRPVLFYQHSSPFTPWSGALCFDDSGQYYRPALFFCHNYFFKDIHKLAPSLGNTKPTLQQPQATMD